MEQPAEVIEETVSEEIVTTKRRGAAKGVWNAARHLCPDCGNNHTIKKKQ